MVRFHEGQSARSSLADRLTHMAVPERLPDPRRRRDARIDAAIGNTPMVRLTRVVEPGMAEVWVKIEGMNPGGSIKDRTALGMIVDAERRGALRPAERSSSRRPATPASASHRWRRRAAIHSSLCLPAQMSEERKRTLLAYGARARAHRPRAAHARRDRGGGAHP